MNTIFRNWSILFLIWSGTAQAATPLNMKSGLWKTKIQVQLPNGRMPFTFSSERCLTPNDPIPNANEGKDCETSEVSNTEDSVSWALQCDGEKGVLKGSGKITFKSDRFNGKMDIKITEKSRSASFIYHLKGEYLGQCPDPKEP